MEEDHLYIIFNKSQRGVTPGQFAAWYTGDELIGSGIIE
jgi:tRNA-specific 2-thiouridylase